MGPSIGGARSAAKSDSSRTLRCGRHTPALPRLAMVDASTPSTRTTLALLAMLAEALLGAARDYGGEHVWGEGCENE